MTAQQTLDVSTTHARRWVQRLTGRSGEEISEVNEALPFSFLYDGAHSQEFLGLWKKQVQESPGGVGFSAYEIIWSDPATGLECRLALKAYEHYPALDWVVYFKNNGSSDTKIIEDIQALDITWTDDSAPPRGALPPAQLWRGRGSPNSIRDFEYLDQELVSGLPVTMHGGWGWSSSEWLPFFNLKVGNLGLLTGIGWTGEWTCTLKADPATGVQVRAGMEKTHLLLHPGEEIRSPRILQLFWTGDRIDAHNQWRRLLMEHYVPRVEGKPVTGPLCMMHWGGMSTGEHLKRIALYREQRLPHEYLWIDAGWYGLHSAFSPDDQTGDWSRHTGDWRVNPHTHPNGLRPIADAAAEADMKFLLWAEPERAIKGTHWPTEHPEWFLSIAGPSNALLLNLGDDATRRSVTDFMIGLIRENRVDLYRQDFNFGPIGYWRENDAEDRQGILEIRYVTGLYAFWDELLKTFPGLIIDNCASGGRRIDLETISRSLPLWRSDWQCVADNDPVGDQTHGMGLSYWVPLHGTGTWCSMPTRALCDTYKARSTMGPAWSFTAFPFERHTIDPTYPWDWFRQMAADFLRARPAFVGDYYPLTEARADFTQWAAYQMNRPDLGEGFLIAFRRKEAPWSTAQFKLRGLDPDATYEIEDADTGKKDNVKGGDLLNHGLAITLPRPNLSALIFYRMIATI
jgi:alpha-galactosidase